MNRRDLLKGIAALPLASALGHTSAALNMCFANCNSVEFASVKIALEGPFAIVLHQPQGSNVITGVTAFSPLTDSNEHDFVFNGVPRNRITATGGSQEYLFSLPPDGLVIPGKPSFKDPRFAPFDTTSRYVKSDHFVRLELPCPDRIIFIRQPESVTLANGTKANMALNHILIYPVDPTNQGIKITCDQLGGDICLEDSDVFTFEVGLPPGTDSQFAVTHALNFYNQKLLQFFPDAGGLKLGSIPFTEPVSPANDKNKKKQKPAQRIKRGAKVAANQLNHLDIANVGEQVSFWPNTTAVECSAGGLIVTSAS